MRKDASPGFAKVFREMQANGSPVQRFDFYDQRTYFQATLAPGKPESRRRCTSPAGRGTYFRPGDDQEAHRRIESTWTANPASAALPAALIRSYAERR